MPAARISSGPSASKRRCSLPAAISSAQAARSLGRQLVRRGVDHLPAAVRPGRGHVRTPGRLGRCTGARSAEHEALDLPAPLLLGLPVGVLVGPSTVPSTIAWPSSAAGSPFSSRTQATLVPPMSSVFAATLAAAVRIRSASRSCLPSPTAPTRCAARRPSAWRRVTRPSSPFSSPTSTSRVRRPSTSRSRPWAAAESSTGSRTAKARTSASTPRAAPQRRRSS